MDNMQPSEISSCITHLKAEEQTRNIITKRQKNRRTFRNRLTLPEKSLMACPLLLIRKAYLEKQKTAAEEGSEQNGALRI